MKKNKYKTFSEMQINESQVRPVLVSTINENISKNGKPFLKITLKDGQSEQTALMFDISAAQLADMGIKKDSIADVDISVSEYQGARNYKIKDIWLTKDNDVNIKDFIRMPPVDQNVMYQEICQLIKNSANDYNGKYTPLSDLAIEILEHYKERYMNSSAAVSMHHNIRGGLLYHSYRMIKSADALCGVYSILDKELMMCGTALHDIGKLWEYDTSFSGSAEFTPSGILFGHLYLGASLIKKFTDGKNYNKEKVQMLIHMILSHHGLHEWGTVTCPSTPEAFALHYIDNIDAKIYTCEDYFENMSSGTITDKKPFGLENRLYKSKLFDSE